jgi:hypothetical protein
MSEYDGEPRALDQRAGMAGERMADLVATLALPLFVLGLVACRLAAGVSDRRVRDTRHERDRSAPR